MRERRLEPRFQVQPLATPAFWDLEGSKSEPRIRISRRLRAPGPARARSVKPASLIAVRLRCSPRGFRGPFGRRLFRPATHEGGSGARRSALSPAAPGARGSWGARCVLLGTPGVTISPRSVPQACSPPSPVSGILGLGLPTAPSLENVDALSAGRTPIGRRRLGPHVCASAAKRRPAGTRARQRHGRALCCAARPPAGRLLLGLRASPAGPRLIALDCGRETSLSRRNLSPSHAPCYLLKIFQLGRPQFDPSLLSPNLKLRRPNVPTSMHARIVF